MPRRVPVGISVNRAGLSPIKPNAPTSLAAGTVTKVSVPLTWTAATVPTGGTAVTSYRVYVNGVFTQTSTGTSATVTGLTAGTQYTFQVSAVNSAGESLKSNLVTATTTSGGGLPGAPGSLRAGGSPTETTIPVQWNAATADPTDATQGYRVYAVGTAAPVATAGPTATTVTITGLTPAVTYQLTVRAYNVNGEGPASNTFTTATVLIPPNAPTGLTAGTATQTSVPLSWTAAPPIGGMPPVTSYRIYQNNVNIRSVTTPSATITGLTGGTTYTFQVTAINADGESPRSNTVSVTTTSAGGVPGGPSALHTTSTATQTSVGLAWTAGTPDATNPTLGYRVYNSGNTVFGTFTNTAGTLNNLQAGTTYTFTVKAYNTIGESVASNTLSVTTPSPSPPPPPPPGGGGSNPNPKFRVTSTASSWYERPLPANAPIHPNSAAMLAWMAKTGTGLQGTPYIGLNGGLGTSTSSTFTSTNYVASASDPLYHISGQNVPAYFASGGPGIRIPVVAQKYYPQSSTANDSPFQVEVPKAADPGGRGFYAWFAMCQWTGSAWVISGTGGAGSVMFTDSYGHARGNLPTWPNTLLGSGRTPQFYQDEPANDCARGINPMIRVVSYPRVKAEGIVNHVSEIFMGNETGGGGRWPLTGFESRHTAGNVAEGTRFRVKVNVDVPAVLATDTALFGNAGSRTPAQAAAYQEACAIGLGWQKYGAIVADNGGNGGNVIKVDATWKKGQGQLWAATKDALRKLTLVDKWEAIADNYDPLT